MTLQFDIGAFVALSRGLGMALMWHSRGLQPAFCCGILLTMQIFQNINNNM